jgi:cytochrome c-type biogenesis protein CcmH
MNMMFWAALLLMLLVAIIILVYPLLRAFRQQSIAYRQSNLELYEDKLKELETDLGEGRIDHERYQIARQEIDRELLQDVPLESRENASLHYSARLVRHPGLALVIAVFLPMVSLLIYMQLGMHAAGEGNVQVQAQAETATETETHPGPGTQESIAKMVQALADRVNANGGTLEEWTMLGRAYKHMGEYAKSATAFEEAVALNGSAQLMLEQAEAIAMQHNRRFTPASRTLALKALAQEPDNVNALWFAGVAEFQAGNYRQSIDHLSKLTDVAQSDEEVGKSIKLYISQARDKLAAAGEQVPPMVQFADASTTSTSPMVARAGATATNTESPKTSTAATGASVQVHVDVSDAVRGKYQGGDTVFVYAKALRGPKMPLAVQRITLDQLPTTVVLDDSMAMMQGMNMSAFGSVMISARLSKSGSAITQSGDYIGQAEVADVSNAGKVNIVIDTQVP